MYYGYKISDETAALARQAEADLVDVFRGIEENALILISNKNRTILDFSGFDHYKL